MLHETCLGAPASAVDPRQVHLSRAAGPTWVLRGATTAVDVRDRPVGLGGAQHGHGAHGVLLLVVGQGSHGRGRCSSRAGRARAPRDARRGRGARRCSRGRSPRRRRKIPCLSQMQRSSSYMPTTSALDCGRLASCRYRLCGCRMPSPPPVDAKRSGLAAAILRAGGRSIARQPRFPRTSGETGTPQATPAAFSNAPSSSSRWVSRRCRWGTLRRQPVRPKSMSSA